MPVDGRPVILTTFAGRRDRMGLLNRYACEAILLGLVDEWHVWDFSRNVEDGDWLAEAFPVLGRTPDDLIYYRAGDLNWSFPWRARVRAANDVHIAIESSDEHTGSKAFEIVVGGWQDQKTVLRTVDRTELLVSVDEERLVRQDPVVVNTPGILSPSAFRTIEISLSASGLTVMVDEALLFKDVKATAPAYRVYVKTGYGSDAEWRFPGSDSAAYLYRTRRDKNEGFNEFYQFYSSRPERYMDAVFLKCDDDIVYIQLGQLEEFIRFRIREPRYFLISANVVNNNVCAYYQQKLGAIPRDLMELELPPGGLNGRLWSSPELAGKLHRHFIGNRRLFETLPPSPIRWSGRLSINFVSWLGSDLSFMSATTTDDEHMLSVQIPGYLERLNCIFPDFVVSHLSYAPQESQLDHKSLLAQYWAVTEELGLGNRASLAATSSEHGDQSTETNTASYIAARTSAELRGGRAG